MRRDCPMRRMIAPFRHPVLIRHPERSRRTPDPAHDEVHEEHRVTEGTSISPPIPCNGLSKGENTKRGVVAASKDFSNPQVRGHLRGDGISFRSSTKRYGTTSMSRSRRSIAQSSHSIGRLESHTQ